MHNTSRQKNKKLSYTLDNLDLLTDEELKSIFINLRTQINKSTRKQTSKRHLEVEFCYIQKEMQDRRNYKKRKNQNRAN